MSYDKLRVLAELVRLQPDEHKPSVDCGMTVNSQLRTPQHISESDRKIIEEYSALLLTLPDAASRAKVLDCLAHEWCNDPGFTPSPDPNKTVDKFMVTRRDLGARLTPKESDVFRAIYGRPLVDMFDRNS